MEDGKEVPKSTAQRLLEALVLRDVYEATASERADLLRDYFRRTALMHAFFEGLPELFLQSSQLYGLGGTYASGVKIRCGAAWLALC